MNEIILEISETLFDDTYEGFLITTSKQKIKFGISDDQQCCEYPGHLSTNDDIQEFIGAEILNINLVEDDDYKTDQMVNGNFIDKKFLVFINIETTKGTLQLAVYNMHNGYYGHEVTIKSEQYSSNFYI